MSLSYAVLGEQQRGGGKGSQPSNRRHCGVSELLRRTINQTNILRVMVVKLAYLLYNIEPIELEMNPICQFSCVVNVALFGILAAQTPLMHNASSTCREVT